MQRRVFSSTVSLSLKSCSIKILLGRWFHVMDSRKSNEDGSDETLLHQHYSSERHAPSVLKTGLRWSTIDGRRLLFATCACLAAASLFGLFSVMIWTQQSKNQVYVDLSGQQTGTPVLEPPSEHTSEPEREVDQWGPLSVLRGPPAESFRGQFSYAIYSITSNTQWARQFTQ